MNGLANAILTMLLSWLRVIVNRIWSIVNSDTGSHFFALLADHWLMLLLILGAGGFVLDKIIYLIRWRPFSVRRRQRELQALEDATGDPWPDESAFQQRPPSQPQPPTTPENTACTEPEPPYWSDPPYGNINNDSIVAQTAVYSHPAADCRAYRPPMEDIEPVFDEQALWTGGDALVSNEQPLTAGISARYMQDVNAGFARPIPPEQLYASPTGTEAANPTNEPSHVEAQPVHPGLDADLLRRNMGLTYTDETFVQDAFSEDEPIAVNFTPFTQ